MPHANGTNGRGDGSARCVPASDRPPTLRQLRDKHERLILEAKISQIERQNKLVEGMFLDPWYNEDLWDRIRQRNSDFYGVPNATPSDRAYGRNWPLWSTEQELDQIRQQSRVVCRTNSFAKGLLFNLTNFLIGRGSAYKVSSKDKADVDPNTPGLQQQEDIKKLIKITQNFVDAWLRRNRWNAGADPRHGSQPTGTREREAYRRVERDGEAFLRFFYADNGWSYVRWIEPEQVRNGPGHDAKDGWSFGVKHYVGADGEDVERIEKYYAVWQNANVPHEQQQGEEIDAADVVHIKDCEEDSTIKRGTPAFAWDVLEALSRASKLQRNISISAAIRAATAEIWKSTYGTKDQINDLAAGHRQRTEYNPITGKNENIEKIDPGTVRRVSEGWEPVLQPNQSGLVTEPMAGVQGDLRQAGTAFSTPEYLVSGDSSNANFASTKEAGTPFIRGAESKQEHLKQAFLVVLWKAINHACQKGLLPRNVPDLLDIQVEMPAVMTRNELEKAQIDQILMMLKVKSPQTVQMEWGLDQETEQLNIEEWEERHGQMGQGLGMPGEEGGEGGGFPGLGGGGPRSGGHQGGAPEIPGLESWLRETAQWLREEKCKLGQRADLTHFVDMARKRGIQEAEGTCKQGERADLTGCTPASGEGAVAKKTIDDTKGRTPRTVSQAVEHVNNLYQSAVDPNVSYEEIEAALSDIENKFDLTKLKQIAKGFGITSSVRTKREWSQKLNHKISERKARSERGEVIRQAAKAAQGKDVSQRDLSYWGSKEQPYWRPGPNPTVDNVITRHGPTGKEVLLIRRAEFSPKDINRFADISERALSDAFGYAPSKPDSFGAFANQSSAKAFLRAAQKSKDIESLAAAVHDGWAETVDNYADPGYLDNPEKLERRRQLADTPYEQLPPDEKEKDRVAARAMLNEFEKNPADALAEGGKWALPGGFHDTDAKKGEPWVPGKETAEQAAMRELAEETGLNASELQKHMKHVGKFEGEGRDPRDNDEAWSVSNAFALHLTPELASKAVQGMDDAANAEWVPVDELHQRSLAFDHEKILGKAGIGGMQESEQLECEQPIREYSGRGIQEAEGTCKQGERADLTGCTPASDDESEIATEKPAEKQKPGNQHTPSEATEKPAERPKAFPPLSGRDQKTTKKIQASLTSSKIKEIKSLGGGANGSFVIRLEDGSAGVFKPGDEEEPNLRDGVRAGTYWRREIAGFEVAAILGFEDLVPVTVKRRLDNGQVGSVQEFVGNSTIAYAVNLGKRFDGETDAARAAVFDYLLGHEDRHQGNWLVRDDGKLVLIDNGLSLPTEYEKRDFFNLQILKVARNLPLPDLSSWQGKWPEIESSLKRLGIEQSAIRLTKTRFDHLLHAHKSGRGSTIGKLDGLIAEHVNDLVKRDKN